MTRRARQEGELKALMEAKHIEMNEAHKAYHERLSELRALEDEFYKLMIGDRADRQKRLRYPIKSGK